MNAITIYTADHLLGLDIPEPDHVVPGILTTGTTLIAGRPKKGKSWLALGLAIAVATGTTALGRIPVPAGDVLYLSLEDSQRRLKARLSALLGTARPGRRLLVTTEWRRLDDGGIDHLREWCEEHPDRRLVVIDTLTRVKPQRPRTVDPYDHEHAVMSDLTTLAGEYGIAVVVVHHTRKALADDWLDTLSGTTGLTGGADAVSVLVGERGSADAVLKLTGRDIEDAEYALGFDREQLRWHLLGSPTAFRLGPTQSAIVRVVQDANGPLMPNEILDILRTGDLLSPLPKYSTVRWHCRELAKRDYLKGWADGKYTVGELLREETPNTRESEYLLTLSTPPTQLTVLTGPTLPTGPTRPP